ncbi:DNA-binding transcriptional regulator, AcrR family [Microlunatus soli]|uniref:DNA-binding transcriptional regulator, AcrR family n=2 Tax=Microlunatus soli TaxID=630515 RepID=A0A1H2ANZ1_9ACTN|nr:DNA-binding transcriptional regulator, AcrR family [Microlunatus soli]
MSAARTCLLRDGYAGTTVRDLVAESGTNQASINYHFGSKDELLNSVLFELNSEWGDLLFGALAAEPPGTDPERRWARVIESIRANTGLWYLNFEAVALAQHDEAIRAGLAERGAAARRALAHAFAGLDEASASAEQIRAVGSRYYGLLIGVALQLITDPDSAPRSADLTADGS